MEQALAAHQSGSGRHRHNVAAVLAAAMLLAGCRSTIVPAGEVVGPYYRPRAAEPVSEAQLRAGAEQAYRQLAAAAAASGALDADAGAASRVRTIVKRLAAAARVFRSEASAWDWQVHVVRSDDLDAWALPGGKVAVGERLASAADLTDDELAALLAHALAHALRGHAAERATEQADRGVRSSAGAQAFGFAVTGDDAQRALRAAAMLPGTRAHEIEADRIGVELAARAGYDPRAAVSLRRKLEALGSRSAPAAWLARHPSSPQRIEEIQTYAQRAMPLYEGASRQTR